MAVNNFNPKIRKYHKTNFVDILEAITLIFIQRKILILVERV
jgi:hypothetical protein